MSNVSVLQAHAMICLTRRLNPGLSLFVHTTASFTLVCNLDVAFASKQVFERQCAA